MIAPGDERLRRIGHLGVDFRQPVEIGVVALDRRGDPAGQPPFHRRDEMAGEQNRRQRRVQVRIDEAGHEHMVPERVVDPVRVRVQPRAQGFGRADLDDAVASHGDSRGNR